VDSYYEYLLKAYIVEGNTTLLDMFETHYRAVQSLSRRGSFHVEVGAVQ
jgi:hypothetical protein